MSDWDLVVRGGTVATASWIAECDVGIHEGRVVQLGGAMRGRRELDARGRLVLPGGVDVHVHLTSPHEDRPGVEVRPDDFYTGSRAALAGGITTIGNMTFQRRGEGLRRALARDHAAAGRLAAVDYLLHAVLVDPADEVLAELPALADDGYTSLKLFMVLEAFDAQVDRYARAMARAASAGLLVLLHCEDGAVVRAAAAALAARGQEGARFYPQSRPVWSETAAIERAVALARTCGAAIYVVHLSSAAALEVCRRARTEGLPVFVEARPLYLYLTRERFDEPDGAKYAGAPPLRDRADVDALWAGLRTGVVDTLGSDHAPWTLAQKLDPTLGVATLRQGVADLETMLPMLFSEGVATGRISLTQFVALTATTPARLFGLLPRKGTIAVGADADLVVWDPQRRRTIDGATMESKAGYSPYDGWEVRGWPVATISRGEVVLDDGEIRAAPGRGRWLRGGRPALSLRDAR